MVNATNELTKGSERDEQSRGGERIHRGMYYSRVYETMQSPYISPSLPLSETPIGVYLSDFKKQTTSTTTEMYVLQYRSPTRPKVERKAEQSKVVRVEDPVAKPNRLPLSHHPCSRLQKHVGSSSWVTPLMLRGKVAFPWSRFS